MNTSNFDADTPSRPRRAAFADFLRPDPSTTFEGNDHD
jgi:hypothetical protein